MVKSRGVPFERTTLLLDEDATVEEMQLAVEEASRNVEKGGTLWFVLVGHGAPAKDGKDGSKNGKKAYIAKGYYEDGFYSHSDVPLSGVVCVLAVSA